MKVKYLGDDTILYTRGQIYEARIEGEGYVVTSQAGQYYEPTWRFEEVSPIEAKKKEISDARNSLEKLEKELAEMTAPKQGQKYKHKDGAIYLLSLASQGYCLVCIESEFPEQVGGVYSYCEGKYPENAFQGFRENFTLIED